MHKKLVVFPVVLMAAVLVGVLADPVPAADLSVDPSGRYYRDAAGNPKFLIGYYGWAAVPDGYYIDHPSRYASMIQQGASYKINYIRISLGVNRFTPTGSPPSYSGTTPVPFAYTYCGGTMRADLDQWDPVFWNGLRAQCALAKQHGVILHIAIFDGVELRPQGGEDYGYASSFWNPGRQCAAYYSDPDLNHDGGIEQNGEFYQLGAFNSNSGIGKYQRLLIDKTLAETASYDNVFYEVGNELLSSPSDWNAAVIAYIRGRTGKPVSQCGGGTATNLLGFSQHVADTPAQVKANVASIVGAGHPAWEDPDGPALSDSGVSAHDLRRAAWYSFVGGAACWGGFTVDFWTGGSGLNIEKAGYYRKLQDFIDQAGAEFWNMSPSHGLVSNSGENSCLARAGVGYVAYVLNDDTLTLDLGAATGDVTCKTYDPRTGVFGTPFMVTGGATRTFSKPAGADDWVLHAQVDVDCNWDNLGVQQTLGGGTTPGIATDSQGNIHVVYMDGGSIYYRKVTPDLAFGPAEAIPAPEGAQPYNSPHVLCDAADVPHVVFGKDWYPNSYKAYYTNRVGGSWKPTVTVLNVDPGTQLVIYPRLSLHGQYAYVGAMIGVDLGWIIRIKNLATTPVVDTTVSASNPLRAVAVTDSAGRVFAMGRYSANGHYFQEYDGNLNAAGGLLKWSGGTYGKTGSPVDAFVDTNDVVHMVAWAIAGSEDICGMVYNNTQRRNGDGSFQNCIVGLIGNRYGPDGDEVSGWWNEDVFPTVTVDDTGRVYIAYREWTPQGAGKITTIQNGAFVEPAATFATGITRRNWWNCQLAPARGGGVYVAWDSGGAVYLRSVGVCAPERSKCTLRSRPVASAITVDGSPDDWNLTDFTSYARACDGGVGDIGLVGFDNGSPCYGGQWTGGVLPTSEADHRARVYSRHGPLYQFFLARIEDSDICCSYGTEMNWANDCVEFYIDPGRDGGSAPVSDSSSDVQLVIDANNQRNVYMCTEAYRAQVLSGISSAVSRDATGWWLEVRVQKSLFSPALPTEGAFGIDFNFRDNDGNNDPSQTTIYCWSDSISAPGFPSKIPNQWGLLSPAANVCLSEGFAYADGGLNGSGGWSGTATSQLSIEDQAVKVCGGAGSCDAVRQVSCDTGTTAQAVRLKVRKVAASTATLWGLWIDDPSGNNLGRWYATASSVRGRVASGSPTSVGTLTGGWDELYVNVDFVANTTQFAFNGVVLGTRTHSAGDSIGGIRIERIDNSGAVGQCSFVDDLSVGVVDADAPSAAVGSPSLSVTRSGPVSYAVSFSEPVFGFSSGSDVQLNPTGTASAASVSVAGSGAGPYTVTLSDLTGDGTLGITVKAGACTDAAGNSSAAGSASTSFRVLGSDGSISAAKLLPDDSPLSLGNKALYLKWPGFGYIEEPARTNGIRVEGSMPAGEDELVCLIGTMKTRPGGERFILLSALSPAGSGPVKPVGVNNRALASMCGMHVKTWGLVKPGSIAANSYVITDGSGDAGIRVITQGAPGVSDGQFVLVTGAAGFEGGTVVYCK